MQRAGVTGHPVEHSLSPVMHNAAFRAIGLDAVYELWPATPDELPRLVERLRQPGYLGMNVTVPHKPAVYRLVDEVRESARRIGAVNTVIPVDGRLTGDNTDAYGFAKCVEEVADVPARAGLVIGAGGASAAVLVAMVDMGLSHIYLANRTAQRAHNLASALGIEQIDVVAVSDLDAVLPETGLLVNATSVGWHDDATPVPVEAFSLLPADAVAVDLTYRETGFLRAARQAGLTAVDGLGMLIHQGARSFTLWTGLEAPVHIMRDAVVAEQQRRSRL